MVDLTDEVTTAFAGWNTFDRELKNIAGDELVTRGKKAKNWKTRSLTTGTTKV